MTVVKVGGSVFDHPALGPGLRDYLTPLAAAGPVLVVPGGGPVADAVRRLDRTHTLGEEAAHWVALRALTVTAAFLRQLVGPLPGVEVIDPFEFAARDEGFAGALPHSWAVTSDSVAARVAAVAGATRLILLKSTAVPREAYWQEAADRGWVDAHFPRAVADAAFAVETVDFRSWLTARRYGA